MPFIGHMLYSIGAYLLQLTGKLTASLLFKGCPMAVAPR